MVLKNVHVIIICVNYTDFLTFTYPHNIKFFEKDNFHIITDKSDTDTISFCDSNKQHYRTFEFFKDAEINKAGAIHMMQKELHEKYPDDWILLLDADIILPEKFETYFLDNCNNNEALYSFKRKDYQNKDDYINKVNLKDYGGVTFMGYMQLYFNKNKYYHSYSKDCSNADTFFRDAFFDTLTLLDNDDYVIHLGIEAVNCKGRVSEKW